MRIGNELAAHYQSASVQMDHKSQSLARYVEWVGKRIAALGHRAQNTNEQTIAIAIVAILHRPREPD
jgi:hypothetical protein